MNTQTQKSFVVLAVIIIFGMGAVTDQTLFSKSSSNQYATVAASVTDIATSTASTSISTLPPETPTDYTDNKNGTITDNYTKLLWMKCPEGMSGNICQFGSASHRQWPKARTACEDLNLAGKTGWRLPTLKELQSIVDSGAFRPAINKNFFGSSNDAYWSSTSLAEHVSGSVFTVLFIDGSTYYTNAGNTAATRCVWDGTQN